MTMLETMSVISPVLTNNDKQRKVPFLIKKGFYARSIRYPHNLSTQALHSLKISVGKR